VIVTVAGLKGGIGKTTTAAYLAHALYEQLCNVLALDADPQASLRTWAKWGEWVIPVEKFAAGRAAQVRPLGWDVVIDTRRTTPMSPRPPSASRPMWFTDGADRDGIRRRGPDAGVADPLRRRRTG
jgi:chromosome partitioning protein